jgi:hypothetical protein
MRISYCISILALVIVGCAQTATNTGAPATADTRTGVIRVGMDFEKAKAILKEHGAKKTQLQVLVKYRDFESGDEIPGIMTHFYNLPDGPTMEIGSEPSATGRLVYRISVSTYEPKSYKNKQDPEHDKFLRSFDLVDEYDLDNPPKLPPLTTMPAASTDTRTSVIFVGMDFARAEAILKEHGVEENLDLQVGLPLKDEDRGMAPHFYYLPAGPCLKIMSEPAKSGSIVRSIAVATYKPKSWSSKTAPERDKFFESFKSITICYLDYPPKLSPQEATVPVTPPATQPASQPSRQD